MTAEQILAKPTDSQIIDIENTCCENYITPRMITRVSSIIHGHRKHGLIIQLDGYKTLIQITSANDPYLMPKHSFNADDIQCRHHQAYSIGGYISTSLTGAVSGALAVLHNRYSKD